MPLKRKKAKAEMDYGMSGLFDDKAMATIPDPKNAFLAGHVLQPCSISSDIFVYKFHLCAIPGESLDIPSVRVVFSLPLVNGRRMFQRQRLGSDRPRDDAEDGAVEGTEATCRPAKRVKKAVAAAPKERGSVTAKGQKQKVRTFQCVL